MLSPLEGIFVIYVMICVFYFNLIVGRKIARILVGLWEKYRNTNV